MANYYMRVDGTAANVAAAIGPATSAADCMNVAVHNAGTFAAGDTIYLSGLGGSFITAIVPPSSGTNGNQITYQGVNTATIDGTGQGIAYLFEVASKSYLTINDIESHHAEGALGSCFCFRGNGSTGLITNDLYGHHSSNQAFQHLNSISITHNNITGSDCTDDGFSMHDAGIAVINTGTFTANDQGINIIADATLTGTNITVSGGTAGYGIYVVSVLTRATMTLTNCTLSDGINVSTAGTLNISQSTITVPAIPLYVDDNGILNLSRCTITGGTSHQVDIGIGTAGGTFTANHCIFKSQTATKFAVAVRAGGAATVNNCVIYDSDSNGYGFYVAAGTLTSRNTIVNSMARIGTYTTGHSIDFDYACTFGNTAGWVKVAGADYGGGNANGITTDPLFVAAGTDFRLARGSPCVDRGVDLGVSQSVDYSGLSQNTNGREWDIGAYVYRKSGRDRLIRPARRNRYS